MSILSVNGDLREDCSVWKFENGKYFRVGLEIEEKVPPKEV
jgi:hypothetical protein